MGAVGTLYRATFIWHLHGVIGNWVTHWLDITGSAGAAAGTLGGDLNGNFLNEIVAITSTAQTFTQIKVEELTGNKSDNFVRIVVGTTAGTNTSAPPTSWVTNCWTLRTALANRHGRGRLYMGGVPFGFISGNLLTSSGLNAYQNRANNLRNKYGSGGTRARWRWVVFARTVNNSAAPSLNDSRARQITSITVPWEVGSHRKRKPGVGN